MLPGLTGLIGPVELGDVTVGMTGGIPGAGDRKPGRSAVTGRSGALTPIECGVQRQLPQIVK
jgi:hypothetical protein